MDMSGDLETSADKPGATRRMWRRRLVNLSLFAILATSSWTVIKVRLNWKFYSLPSQSMLPALQKGDRFIADKRMTTPLQRGDVVVFKVPASQDVEYVKRIAGLPGDRIEMRGGDVWINGTEAKQTQSEAISFVDDVDGPVEGKTFSERFPGEAFSHSVIDLDHSAFDEVAPITVPAGRYFMLGDNRDRSADSRVSVTENGSGLVPHADIVAHAYKIYWSGDRSRIGKIIQ